VFKTLRHFHCLLTLICTDLWSIKNCRKNVWLCSLLHCHPQSGTKDNLFLAEKKDILPCHVFRIKYEDWTHGGVLILNNSGLKLYLTVICRKKWIEPIATLKNIQLWRKEKFTLVKTSAVYLICLNKIALKINKILKKNIWRGFVCRMIPLYKVLLRQRLSFGMTKKSYYNPQARYSRGLLSWKISIN